LEKRNIQRINFYHQDSWHQQESSSGQQVTRGLITVHHQLASTCSTSEEMFSTCLLPKFLWSQFSNSNWKHNNSFLACFPRDSSSINRRGHWRSNARVWNTKQLSLSKQKAIKSLQHLFRQSSLYLIENIFLYLYLYKDSLFETQRSKQHPTYLLFETLDPNNIFLSFETLDPNNHPTKR